MPGKAYLYENVSHRLRQHIHEGSYRAGEKLPSVRVLSRLFHVSVNTILQCFRQLEADGLIHRIPRSGVIVAPTLSEQKPTGSAPRPIPLLPVEVSLSEEILRYMEPYTSRPMTRFGIALPDSEIMPVERVLQAFREVTRSHGVASWHYAHPRGGEAFAHQLARRSLNYPMPVTEQDLLVTNGCMEAIELALRVVTKRGDAVAIETPAYYGTLLALEVLGRKALPIPTHPQRGIRLAALEQAMRQGQISACIISANAQNPLGFSMPTAHREKLAQLAGRYKVPVIENDIWGDTVFGEAQLPVKAFDREGEVIYCNSFSKSLMPGMRLGWIAPGRFLHRVLELKQVSNITTASAPQLVMAKLMESGFYHHHLQQLRTHLQCQTRELMALSRQYFPVGTRINEPAGGCVLWLELPGAIDTGQLFDRALAQQIHIFPGRVFSPAGRHTHCLRLNAGSPITPDIAAAVRKLGVLAHQQLT
ncbi:MAG: DNA-binding transcriptional MocR family regulator [Marinobacter maritimus]|jgi:DNA-binding transcriptional MocR family regulator|tara:strand:- start:774 stop:2201 length:1428 start_codon:yes stop_codon:yes gene_type:complete